MFMDDCLDGTIPTGSRDAEIDKAVEAWHNIAGNTQPLNQFLGMTDLEYAIWAEQPNLLSDIIFARKKNKGICTKNHPNSNPKAIHTDYEVLRTTEDWEYGQMFDDCRCRVCGALFDIAH